MFLKIKIKITEMKANFSLAVFGHHTFYDSKMNINENFEKQKYSSAY